MIKDPPVRFRRAEGMAALPLPTRGGSIKQLRSLVNLTDDGFVLYVSCILDTLCPGHPHPVLYLAGEEGSTKSTVANIARSLTDPSTVPLRNLPSNIRDLFVSAHDSYTLAFDNVSAISAAVSDALCQIVSGSGFGTRKLFTDTAQTLISGHRPIIINGLLNAINRSDLADRAVIIPMSRISDEQRWSEANLWDKFEAQRSQIFGALFDRVVCGLRRLPVVRLRRLPRMADFAQWSVATEAFDPGVFISAFERAASEANETVAETDPVAIAVAAFMMGRDRWGGTAAELLGALSSHDRAEAQPSAWKTWRTNRVRSAKKYAWQSQSCAKWVSKWQSAARLIMVGHARSRSARSNRPRVRSRRQQPTRRTVGPRRTLAVRLRRRLSSRAAGGKDRRTVRPVRPV